MGNHAQPKVDGLNKSLFEIKWPQLRGQLKAGWDKLSDDDLERVAGNFDQFISLLQEKYGYSRPYAEEKFHRRMARLGETRVEVEFERRLAKFTARPPSQDLL